MPLYSKVMIEDDSTKMVYPCLMRSKLNEEMVVLFTERMHGTVVKKGTSRFSLGYVTSDWAMANFKHFHGSVTLKQT